MTTDDLIPGGLLCFTHCWNSVRRSRCFSFIKATSPKRHQCILRGMIYSDQLFSTSFTSSQPTSTSEDVLASSSKALGTTLGTLSQRLLLLSGQPTLDLVTISQTADAISKTGQALDVISYLLRKQALG